MPQEQSQKNFTNFNWCFIKHIVITGAFEEIRNLTFENTMKKWTQNKEKCLFENWHILDIC